MLTPIRGALFISTVELTCAGPPGVPLADGVEVGVAVAVLVAVLVGVAPTPLVEVAVGVAPTPEVGVEVGVNVGAPAAGRYAINALAHVVELFVVHPVLVEDRPFFIRYPLSRFVFEAAVAPALSSVGPVKPFIGPDERLVVDAK